MAGGVGGTGQLKKGEKYMKVVRQGERIKVGGRRGEMKW